MGEAAFHPEDRIGIAGAVVLHALVVAALALQFAFTTPRILTPERMTVSLATEVSLESTAPDPVPESRAAIAPTLAEEPAPPVEEAPPVRQPEAQTPPPPPQRTQPRTQQRTTTPPPDTRNRRRPEEARSTPAAHAPGHTRRGQPGRQQLPRRAGRIHQHRRNPHSRKPDRPQRTRFVTAGDQPAIAAALVGADRSGCGTAGIRGIVADE